MISDITSLDRDDVVDAISMLETQLFGAGAWTANMVRQELDAPARTYLLDLDETTRADENQPAVNGMMVRGYAGFWYDGDDAELMTIGVNPVWQRQGVASMLLRQLIAQARDQGVARMLLEVRTDNEPALRLYEQFGFTRLGLRKRYYMPEGKDAYTMALDLQPRVVGFQAA
ncbi:ribosomal protein S18-alanine N-acetyltransferase [Bifidobacterium gallicum]|uniref:Alanine acetyltransferase n=1 Tax=Bifidobacterium gallicum DSM 20093 = LMG 11596 TaxID=561180 RepID=D1NTT9_9BIFI|nr:ribosomal protein S18-alanine N-acetyltransferase [Bifidobacterium gallicum]EFA23143.1 ribosomal-protein-alanine acetyltransferase [Bifidobacterium gallicum DSM 20093 = LMG 11596]KFI58815.1 alanine acetyltransferase [Bifidobacterium gallicum DSM 20093 = LMG 11596]